MVNYQKGKIYKIVCNITNKIYIGSTCETLSSRLTKHRYVTKNKEQKKGCCSSYEILKNNDYEIILIENYPCNNREELLMRERYYVDNMDCVNKRQPISTKEETRNRQNEWQKQHYKNNKDKINEWRRKPVICDVCGSTTDYIHKSRHQKSQKCLAFKNNIL